MTEKPKSQQGAKELLVGLLVPCPCCGEKIVFTLTKSQIKLLFKSMKLPTGAANVALKRLGRVNVVKAQSEAKKND